MSAPQSMGITASSCRLPPKLAPTAATPASCKSASACPGRSRSISTSSVIALPSVPQTAPSILAETTTAIAPPTWTECGVTTTSTSDRRPHNGARARRIPGASLRQARARPRCTRRGRRLARVERWRRRRPRSRRGRYRPPPCPWRNWHRTGTTQCQDTAAQSRMNSQTRAPVWAGSVLRDSAV